MKTFIYRCSRKPDLYIYLAEEDNFDDVPKAIYNSLGIIEFAMELEIKKGMRLAREKPEKILGNLETHGFHIQLPDNDSIESIMAKIARSKLS